MKVTLKKADPIYSRTSNFPFDYSGSADLGTGPDRTTFVIVPNESWSDLEISNLTIGGQAATRVKKARAPGGGHAEYLDVWMLSNPPSGTATVSMQNNSSSVDVHIAVVTVDGIQGTFSGAEAFYFDGSGNASDSHNASGNKAVFFAVARNGSGGDAFQPVTGEMLDSTSLGYNGTGLSYAFGVAEPTSAGPIDVGFTQPGTDWESVLIAFEVDLIDSGSGGGDPDPDPDPEPEPDPSTGDCTDCLTETEGDQRYASKAEFNALQNQVNSGDPGTGGNTDLSDYYTKSQSDARYALKGDTGGGGNGIALANRHYISTDEFGIGISNDPGENRGNLQAFFNFMRDQARRSAWAVLGGQSGQQRVFWDVNNRLFLHDGLKLMGPGMDYLTIRGTNWASGSGGTHYTVLHMDASDHIITGGLHLRDFAVEGADKNAKDDGPLIRIETLEDFNIERLRVVDASSYGIYITGYGLGSYQNDPTSDYWRNAKRGVVRDCVAIRGQIGYGTEGGARGILFDHNFALGNFGRAADNFGLHAFRSASGEDIHYTRNYAVGYRNAFLLERWRNINIQQNILDGVRNGVAMGAFYQSDNHPQAYNLQLHHNNFRFALEQGKYDRSGFTISDTYLSDREMESIHISNNVIDGSAANNGGRISLAKAKRLSIHDNEGKNSGAYISTRSDCTGKVHNNNMDHSNSASGVSGSNNSFAPGYTQSW